MIETKRVITSNEYAESIINTVREPGGIQCKTEQVKHSKQTRAFSIEMPSLGKRQYENTDRMYIIKKGTDYHRR
jgi:hypothetical protein